MKTKKIEYEEAILAGENVLLQIEVVLRSLDSSRNWGILDMFSRGGFLSAALKYSKLEDAEVEMDKLRSCLEEFNDELDDIAVEDVVGDISIDGFTKFADFFFDNAFTDIVALSKINGSKKRILELKYRVDEVMDILHKLKDEIEE